MKTKLLSLMAIFMIAIFSNNVMAQNTATDAALAYATIIAPITINNTVDLNFGDVIDGTGYVTLSTQGVRSTDYQAFSGTQVGTVTAASFDVTGEATYTFAITLPASATLTETGLDTMTVDTFVSYSTTLTADSATGTLDGSGDDTVLVGATLHVVSGQTVGLYSGTFDVTVAYN